MEKSEIILMLEEILVRNNNRKVNNLIPQDLEDICDIISALK